MKTTGQNLRPWNYPETPVPMEPRVLCALPSPPAGTDVGHSHVSHPMACDLDDRGTLRNGEYRDRWCSGVGGKLLKGRRKRKGRQGKWERRKEKKPEKYAAYRLSSYTAIESCPRHDSQVSGEETWAR